MRFRSKVRRSQTPLRLRHSIKRLRYDHKNPYFALLKLFVVHLQLPSLGWSYDYPVPKLLTPKDIVGNEDLFNQHHPHIFNLRYIPTWIIRDTPPRALYRLYEIFMTREFVLLPLECEYMYRQSGRKWSLFTIPDPCDPDLVRYAMLASVAEEVVEAFNWRLANGLRRNGDIVRKTMENPYPAFDPEVKPSWTSLVPPTQAEDLSELPSDMVRNRLLVLDEDGRLRTLRNFVAPTRYLYTT